MKYEGPKFDIGEFGMCVLGAKIAEGKGGNPEDFVRGAWDMSFEPDQLVGGLTNEQSRRVLIAQFPGMGLEVQRESAIPSLASLERRGFLASYGTVDRLTGQRRVRVDLDGGATYWCAEPCQYVNPETGSEETLPGCETLRVGGLSIDMWCGQFSRGNRGEPQPVSCMTPDERKLLDEQVYGLWKSWGEEGSVNRAVWGQLVVFKSQFGLYS